MCISPDQLSSAKLEEELVKMAEYAADPMRHPTTREYYRERIKKYEALLKERAENGTYSTAGK